MAVGDAVRERPDKAAREQFLARRRIAANPVHHRRLVAGFGVARAGVAGLGIAHPRSFSRRCLSCFPSSSLIDSRLCFAFLPLACASSTFPGPLPVKFPTRRTRALPLHTPP